MPLSSADRQCCERISAALSSVAAQLAPDLRGIDDRPGELRSLLYQAERCTDAAARIAGDLDRLLATPAPSPGTVDALIRERDAVVAAWLSQGRQAPGPARLVEIDRELARLHGWASQ